MVMSDEHDQFCVHSPSHWLRAVQPSAAFFYLQQFKQPLLHLHESSSQQVWAASGRCPVWLVPSIPTHDPLSTGCWWQQRSREQHLALNMTNLVCCPLYKFLHSSFGWWNMSYIMFLCKEFPSSLVCVCACGCPNIYQNDKPLNGVENISRYELRCR